MSKFVSSLWHKPSPYMALYTSKAYPSRDVDAYHQVSINNMLYSAELRLEITRTDIGRNHEVCENVPAIA